MHIKSLLIGSAAALAAVSLFASTSFAMTPLDKAPNEPAMLGNADIMIVTTGVAIGTDQLELRTKEMALDDTKVDTGPLNIAQTPLQASEHLAIVINDEIGRDMAAITDDHSVKDVYTAETAAISTASDALDLPATHVAAVIKDTAAEHEDGLILATFYGVQNKTEAEALTAAAIAVPVGLNATDATYAAIS
ncbi:MAG: hypothetical protein COY40_04335 [Alphaproteobacteria bacterium CG_4_10_14_0_8_um_filter_53_9]|nr:MAG: hypothetical protein COY40_04335 [Alphaproteobacteria bacterium CG_4_10_14_0_8_um_filter_53_9]